MQNNNDNIKLLSFMSLTRLPLLKVQRCDESEPQIVGSSFHDAYILGKDGGLHYMNMQGSISTEFSDEAKFIVDDPPEYEVIRYFDTIDLFDLMDIDAKRFYIDKSEEYLKCREELRELFSHALNEAAKKRDKKLIEVLKKDFKSFLEEKEEE